MDLTLDKLESIPGCPYTMSNKQYTLDQLKKKKKKKKKKNWKVFISVQ